MSDKTSDDKAREFTESVFELFGQALASQRTSASPTGDVETAATQLGAFRKALIKEGFDNEQAFDIVFEVLRLSLAK